MVRVQAGYLEITAANVIPKTAKIAVEGDASGGGTLLVSGAKAFTTDTPITLAGTGVDGTKGAIYQTVTDSTYTDQIYTHITLGADALLCNESTRPLRFDKTLDMAQHTITYRSAKNQQHVFYATAMNPGTVRVESGSFRPGYGYAQTAGGRVVLAGGQLQFYKWGTQKTDYFPWTIETAWSGTPNAVKNPFGGATPDPYHQELAGPFILNGGWTNRVSSNAGNTLNCYRLFAGDISGTGSLSINDKGNYVHFAGTNTMNGTLLIQEGNAVLRDKKAVPQEDANRIWLGGDTANLMLCAKGETAPNGFTGSDFYDYARKFAEKNVFLYADGNDVTLEDALTINRETVGAGGFGYGVCNGSVTFKSRWLNYPFVATRACGSGSVVFAAAEAGESIGTLHQLSVNSGTTVLRDAGYVLCTNAIMIGTTDTPIGRLIVGANTAIDQVCADYTGGKPVTMLKVAPYADSRGILEVENGGHVTNWLAFALGSRSVGAAYVRTGGDLFNTGRPGNDVSMGGADDDEAYLEIDGGAYSVGEGFYIGSANKGLGMMYVKGGTFDTRGTWGSGAHGPHIGREGTGVVYQCGGTLTSPGYCFIGSSTYRTPEDFARPGHSVYALDGATARARVGRCLYFGVKSFGASYLALNAGATLETPALEKPLAQPGGQGAKYMPYYHILSNMTCYLSFDGGRLRAGGSSDVFLGCTNTSARYAYLDPANATKELTGTVRGSTTPDYLTVYAGGAILDCSNFNVTVQAPLVRPPAAGGIASISIPGGKALSNYIAPPVVEITGDGQGALAVAVFDSTNGCVTGVKVIAPGWGYTAAKTTVRLRHGYAKPYGMPVVTNMSFTVAENVATGGLTVEGGSGTLTLAAANTYGGATRVLGGTLKIAHASALPAGTNLALGDGVVDMNGYAIPSGVTVSIDDPASFASRSKSFTPMKNVSGEVTVTNAGELPPRWRIARRAGELRAIYDTGMCIILR